MKLFKKYVRTANAWLVFWQERKNNKVVDHREFFAKEEDANKFIKEQNEISPQTK